MMHVKALWDWGLYTERQAYQPSTNRFHGQIFPFGKNLGH